MPTYEDGGNRNYNGGGQQRRGYQQPGQQRQNYQQGGYQNRPSPSYPQQGNGGGQQRSSEDGNISTCKFCGQDIQWFRCGGEKSLPFDVRSVEVLSGDSLVTGQARHDCRPPEARQQSRGNGPNQQGYSRTYGDQGRRGNGGMDNRR